MKKIGLRDLLLGCFKIAVSVLNNNNKLRSGRRCHSHGGFPGLSFDLKCLRLWLVKLRPSPGFQTWDRRHWGQLATSAFIQLPLQGYFIQGVAHCATGVHNWGLAWRVWVSDLSAGCRGLALPQATPRAAEPDWLDRALSSHWNPASYLLTPYFTATVLHLLYCMSTGAI